METGTFVTVVRDRLPREIRDGSPDMPCPDPHRVLDGFEERRTRELANLQFEVTELRLEFKQEMQRLRTDIGREFAERSADSMQWAMLFWIGQVLAIAGIVSWLR